MQTASSPYELVVPPEIRSRARLRWRLSAVVVLTVAIAAIVLAATRPWHSPPAEFRTTPVEKRNITQVVEATGHLNVTRRTDVPAPAAGALVESLVHEGQTVKQGEPLARLDERAAEIALRSARAALESAKSKQSQARASKKSADNVLARTLRLAARGLASDSEVVAARLSRAKARAGVAAARAERNVAVEQLAQAELTKKQRTLVAPVAGVVLSAPDSLGAIVAPDRGLFVIGDSLDPLLIDAWVAEADIGQVAVGQKATFTVPAYPGRKFEAVVRSIGIDANRQGNNVRYLVKLDAKNDDKRLLPGMTTTLRIAVAHADHALAVREAALRFSPDGSSADRSRVWRLSGTGTLQAVHVVTGVSDGAYTEVHAARGESLDAGNAVVIGRALPTGNGSRGPGISLGGR